MLSVVVPVYGAPAILPALYERLVAALEPWTDFELVLVNDNCPCGSGPVLDELAAKDARVKVIHFIRNYGQHTAITAGLDHAEGDYAVVMDCDLQDQPEEIKKMYDHLLAGDYDAVFGIRAHRRHGPVQRATSWLYANCLRLLVRDMTKTKKDLGNFSVISRKTVLGFRRFRERERLYGVIVGRILSHKAIGLVEVAHAQREEGHSSYNFARRLRLAAHTIIANSNKPLLLAIFGALGSFGLATVLGLRTLVNYFIHGQVVSGWTSLMLVFCFFSGLQMLFLGILGAYLADVINAVKGRPLYIVDHRLNFDGPRFAADDDRERDPSRPVSGR